MSTNKTYNYLNSDIEHKQTYNYLNSDIEHIQNIQLPLFRHWAQTKHATTLIQTLSTYKTYNYLNSDIEHKKKHNVFLYSFSNCYFFWKRCSVHLNVQLFVGGLVSFFMLFVFAGVWWCPTYIALCFCFVFLVLFLLSVCLDCPFLIASSVFSNVYFLV